MLRNLGQALWALLMLVAVVQAQFNLFEHMFGANQQQQHHQQGSHNVPSDSERYQNSWRQGKSRSSLERIESFSLPLSCLLFTDTGYFVSQLNAATTYAPEHLHASLFLTTAHVRIPMSKKKSS